MDLIKQ